MSLSETILPCVILDRPQMAENIGAVARVMANFGLCELRLVSPRDGWPQERAWACASGAHWPLDGAKVFDSVAQAVEDLHIVYATTARNREVQLPVITPRQCASRAYDEVHAGHGVGFLFGAERMGLESQALGLSHYIVTIPVDPRFHSLNLAQAVALIGYEYRQMVMDAPRPEFTDAIDPPAELKSVHGLYEHLESELDQAGFFFPLEKREQMVRNLRIALGRAHLTEQEVRTWRGVVKALSKGRGQALENIAKLRAKKA